jgi:site-specific recombinase XerD
MKAHENFTHYITYLQNEQYSIKTIASYIYQIEHYSKWINRKGESLLDPSYNLTLKYLDHLKKKGNSTRTRAVHLNSLKRYFTYLRKQGIIDQNPIANLILQGARKDTLYNILNQEQLETLYYSYPENTNIYIRNKIILGLYIYQGISSMEVSKLEPDHINLRQGVITIPEGRQSNERTIKLAPMQMLLLDRYQREVREQLLEESEKDYVEALLFSQGTGSGVNNVLYRLAKQIRPTTYKQIRASVITHWLKSEGLRKAQYLAGHRYVSSTEKYQVNDMESLTNDLKAFRPSLTL